MASTPKPVREAQRHGETVADSRGFEWFARSGMVARGFVYGIIGVLAIKLALGDSGGGATDQQDALKRIAQQPFGKYLLIATAVGLAGYATWRLVRAAIGHDAESDDSAFERIGGIVSGVSYAVLCVAAIEIVTGSGSSSGGNAAQTTGGVLGWTGGTWLVGIAGVITFGEGLEQGYKGIKQKFSDKWDTTQMSPQAEVGFTWLGVAGHLARMAIFCLIGYFLVKAAIDFNPKDAVSLDGALGRVARASYGPFLLGVVAAGLIAFGAYSLVDARYRKV